MAIDSSLPSVLAMHPTTDRNNQAGQSLLANTVHPGDHSGATAPPQQGTNSQARGTNQDYGLISGKDTVTRNARTDPVTGQLRIETITFDGAGNRNQAFENMTEGNLREAIANLFGYADVGNGLGYMSPVQQAAQQAYAHFQTQCRQRKTQANRTRLDALRSHEEVMRKHEDTRKRLEDDWIRYEQAWGTNEQAWERHEEAERRRFTEIFRQH
ncbi:hypothetical protein NLJ89_g2338 [Agrocybe chaxingu]|uniref:Uncharacterized protein n=1 Tax=Agrocybe chaxingu TaxID=84603 RepID=A0A9W8K4K7_9AGAR|nr:hypothetical protein NLJ89_g2338 [Agrocybe chaxingu]